ncbi:MAG: single-stranded DNA-binding protein, partial [Chitinophagia bacterium]|nr:single-stranded DNA-binding protein [Chitinophagia bacterium]
MKSLNRVQLLGRLGGDPEVRSTQNGTNVANFNIATSEKYTKDGETQEKTQWHRVVAWGKL